MIFMLPVNGQPCTSIQIQTFLFAPTILSNDIFYEQAFTSALGSLILFLNLRGSNYGFCIVVFHKLGKTEVTSAICSSRQYFVRDNQPQSTCFLAFSNISSIDSGSFRRNTNFESGKSIVLSDYINATHPFTHCE